MKAAYSILFFCLVVFSCSGQTPYGDYRVLVDVTGNGFSHNTQIYFDDESWDPQNPPSYSWDPCCDAQLILGATDRPHVFTEVVEPPAPSPNYRLALNGLPHLFEPTDVPLGFLPGTLAPYVFTFTDLHTLPQGVTVELEDLSLNVSQDLLVDSTYDTWGAPSDDEHRFILHFYPSSVTDVEGRIWNETVAVDLSQTGMSITSGVPVQEILLFDMMGRQVFSKRILNKNIPTTTTLELAELPLVGMGVLVVRLSNGRIVTRKLVF